MSLFSDHEKEFEFHKTRVRMQVDPELKAIAVEEAEREFRGREIGCKAEERELIADIQRRLRNMHEEIGNAEEIYEIKRDAETKRIKKIANEALQPLIIDLTEERRRRWKTFCLGAAAGAIAAIVVGWLFG